mmetsp:Transcript_11882/g.20030  ORF Transcript_11882/g.20030 Transcript_11882/m.20030 type:complete len:107 (-) Transcript_11882:94-414(-)
MLQRINCDGYLWGFSALGKTADMLPVKSAISMQEMARVGPPQQMHHSTLYLKPPPDPSSHFPLTPRLTKALLKCFDVTLGPFLKSRPELWRASSFPSAYALPPSPC